MKKATNKYTANLRMSELEHACIIQTKKTYSKTDSGKSWRSKPEETNCEKITAEQYFNMCDSVPWFKNLVKGTAGSENCDFGYTYAGYIPVEIRSVSPDGRKKVVRRFTIVDNEETARAVYKLNF